MPSQSAMIRMGTETSSPELDRWISGTVPEGTLGTYRKGEHVKIEIKDELSGESEWMWLLVESSDDRQQLVFGKLDSQPIVNMDMRLGQELAVAYDKIRDRRTFD